MLKISIPTSTIHLSVQQRWKGFIPQYSTRRYLLLSHDHSVYRYQYATQKIKKLFTVPPRNNHFMSKLKNSIARSYPIRHIHRSFGLTNVIAFPDNSIMVLYDRIYFWHPDTGVRIISDFKALDFYPPLKGGIALDQSTNSLFFGEYQNDRPYNCKILQISRDNFKPTISYRFGEGTIKHIHSVTWDPFRNRLWVTTGDTNDESGIYWTDNYFKTLHCIGAGSQFWRAVSLLITETDVIWATDAGKDADPESKNWVVIYNIKKKSARIVCTLDNPGYYMSRMRSGRYVLSTTFEPEDRRSNPPETALWFSEDGVLWHKGITNTYKDSHKHRQSTYAITHIPSAFDPIPSLFFTQVNVSKHEFVCQECTMEGDK